MQQEQQYLFANGTSGDMRRSTLSDPELGPANDLARQLSKDIKESQAAMGRAVEAKNALPKTKQYARKTVASDGYTTLSGWDGKTTKAPSGFNRVTPDDVRVHSEKIGHELKQNIGNDYNIHTKEGWPGKFNASHAEKQMTILSPSKPIGVSKPMCDDCQAFFSKQAQYTGKPQIVTDPEVTRIFMPDGNIENVPLPK
jgi:hypothetical protein